MFYIPLVYNIRYSLVALSYILQVYVFALYASRVSHDFQPKGALLLVGVARAFRTVGQVQRSVRRMAKHTLKENKRGYGRRK